MVQFSASNNSILVVCAPVFNLLSQVQQDKLPVSIELHSDFVHAFQMLDNLAQTHFIADLELMRIKSCLAIHVDNVMLIYQKQALLMATSWPDNHMQLTLFKCKKSHAEVCEELEILLKNAKTNFHLLELYYVCLAQGLRKEDPNNAPLSRLKTQELIRIRGHAERELSLGCDQNVALLNKVTEPLPLYIILILTVVFFTIGFFSIEYILRTEIEAHYYYIREQAKLLINVVSGGRE